MVRRFARRLADLPVLAMLELAGFGCIVAAAYLWIPLAGLVALGVVLILIANSQAMSS